MLFWEILCFLLLFSSLSWISVPEKNIGYEFLFRLRQREILEDQNYYEKQSLETSNSGYALKQQVSKLWRKILVFKYFQSLSPYSLKFISDVFLQYVIAYLMN